MKQALTNLLILCSLILCSFVAVQWFREARLRADVQALRIESQKKSESLANLEGMVKNLQTEITRLDLLKEELTSSAGSNRQELAQLRIELRTFLREKETMAQEANTYKEALANANNNIRQQNEDIRKQNEALKLLADQRNAAVSRQNEVIQQYNDLVKKFNEVQELLSKANTTKTQ